MSIRSRIAGRRRPGPTDPIAGTTIGDIDGPTAIVDRRGTIGALDGSWRFEWGAGADDGWHVAHQEPGVRQTRVDDAPVFETTMRVPGGEVACRVGSVTDGARRSLLLEFTNASPGAVALGCTLRFAAPTLGRRPRVLTVDRTKMRIDASVVLTSMRPAGGVGAGGNDPWGLISAEPKVAEDSVEVRDTGGFAAMVVPLPHRALLLMRIELDPESAGRAAAERVGRAVSLAEVAAGWRAVTRRAVTIDVPDTRMTEAWRRIVPDLVIAAGSDDPVVAAEVAPFLDAAGLHDEADRARATVVVAVEAGRLSGPGAVAAVGALTSRDLLVGQPSGLDQLIGRLLADAGALPDPAVLAAASMAVAPHDPRLADELARLVAESDHAESTAPARDRTVDPSRGNSPASAATVILDHLIGCATADRIDLLPTFPADWSGRPLDVRGLVTRAGTLSFSLRWHGARPALLWERTGGPEGAALACPGIDPTWSTIEREGEALLAAPRESD